MTETIETKAAGALRRCVAVVMALIPAGAAYCDGIWKTSLQEGVYDDPASWVGDVFPGAGTNAYLDSYGDAVYAYPSYTIRFTNEVSDMCRTYVRGLRNGQTVVFEQNDGAGWFKGAESFSDENYKWGFALTQNSGQTGDNLSIHPAVFPALGPCFYMTGGRLSYTRDDEAGNTIAFGKGTWNWYDPKGHVTSNTMYVGYANNKQAELGPLLFTVGDGASLRGYNLKVASKSMEITGGEHHLENELAVGNLKGLSATLDVSGGSLYARSIRVGTVIGTNHAATDTNLATMRLSGTAQVEAGGPFSVCYGVNAAAKVELADESTLTVNSTTEIGSGSGHSRSGILATLVITNDATFATKKSVLIGNTIEALVEVAGSGKIVHSANNAFSVGLYREGTLRMKDDATAVFSSPLSIAPNGKNGGGTIDLRGNSSVSFVTVAEGSGGNGYNITVGSADMTYPKACTLCLRDNAKLMTMNDTYLYLQGTNTLVELSGGAATFRNIYAYGGEGGDCRMRVTGGTHWFLGSALYFARGCAANGTTVYNGRTMVYEQTGGEVTLSDSGVMKFAAYRKSTSVGRCELKGGVVKGKIVGGDGSAVNGGSGRAELFADGCTVETLFAAGQAYIAGFDEAVLGEKGLTFKSTVGASDPRADIKQAFTDDDGVTGRFIKTGDGVARFFTSSLHGVTEIAGGTAYFMEGLGRFGRQVTVTNGATLDVAESISAEKLSLGSSSGTAGTLKLADGVVVTLTGDDPFAAPFGYLDYAPASTPGTYTVFRLTGEADLGAFKFVVLKQATDELRYSFKFASDGTDTLVQLVTYDGQGVSPIVWNGSDGDFLSSANWGGSLPDMTNSVTFPSSSAVKEIAIDGEASIDGIVVEGGDYTFAGTGPVNLFNISVQSGMTAFSVPFVGAGCVLLDVAQGSRLDISGAISGAFSARKTGDGFLGVNTGSMSANVDWALDGGLSVFGLPEMLGAGSGSVQIGQAALSFAGAGEAAYRIVAAAGADNSARIDAQADVTLAGGLDAESGGVLKTGAGKLTVLYPEGEFTLSKDDLGLGRNAGPGNSSSNLPPLSADGVVTSSVALAGFTVREGTVRLEGAGPDKTTVVQDYATLVGAKYENDVADAVLEIANLTFDNSGTDYRRPQIGLRVSGEFVRPTIRVSDNARFNVQGLLLGSEGGVSDWYPTFEISNATCKIGSSLYMGQDGKTHRICHPTVRIFDGADVSITAGSTSLGISMSECANILIDGGVLRTSAECGGLIYTLTSSGGVTVRNGGELRVSGVKSTSYLYGPSTNCLITLDNGVLEFLSSREDVVKGPQRRYVVLGEGGGTVRVGEGLRYVTHTPIRGDGVFTKSGAGEFVIGEGQRLGADGDAGDDTVTASGLATAAWTNRTVVAEGTLTFEEKDSLPGRAFEIAKGAVLDLDGYDGVLSSVSGGGTVSNAAPASVRIFASATSTDPSAAPLLDVSAPGRVLVDFGFDRTQAPEFSDDPVAVARLGDGVAFDPAAWRARNCGHRTSATFSCIDGVVYAVPCPAPGLTIIYR